VVKMRRSGDWEETYIFPTESNAASDMWGKKGNSDV